MSKSRRIEINSTVQIERDLVAAVANEDSSALESTLARAPDLANVYLEDLFLVSYLFGLRQYKMADIALKKGADPNHAWQQKDGSTMKILHFFVARGDASATNTLIKNGADINGTIADGVTPSMVAAFYGKPEPLKLLVSAGADLSIKDVHDQTALDIAEGTENEDCTKIIREALQKKSEKENAHNSTGNLSKIGKSDASPKPKFIGQDNAKAALGQIIATAKINEEKRRRGLKASQVSFHSIFVGSPGTGKTSFARYYANEIRALGILKKGHLVECSRSDLVAGYAGQTAIKTTAKFKDAIGGVLFIDEAYSLKNADDDSYGQEAIDTLLKLMEDHRNDVILILAGYEKEMRLFLDTNSGMKSRIPNTVLFEDFRTEELREIFMNFVEADGYTIDNKDVDYAIEQVLNEKRGTHFGNARAVRNLFERIIKQQNSRIAKMTVEKLTDRDLQHIIYSDITPDESDEGTRESLGQSNGRSKELLSGRDRLQSLIGLSKVKQVVSELADFVEISKMRNPGSANLDIGLHMAFLGRPGTGKTTVARIIGSIFKDLGILPSGHVVECDRSLLVGEYVGQTAVKTKKKIEEALGGILFVDEAYSLSRLSDSGGSDFGKEAIETILKYMEDHRGQLVCVFAGYNDEMEAFFKSNPGLKSRIPNILAFDDYQLAELAEIAKKLMLEKGYSFSDEAASKTAEVAFSMRDSADFANARTIRNLIDSIIKRQSVRLAQAKRNGTPKIEKLNEILIDDVVQK
jgi:SpoVK/Ycf46/Vps4 family AAA+-type ATPase